MRGKLAALIMAALLLLYVLLVGQRAYLLLISGSAVGVVMGVSLIVLPVLAVVFVAREVIFGIRTEKLVRALGDAGELADLDYARTPSGRPLRAEADARFGAFRDEVQSNPTRWQSWFRLGLAYDACGDRRRARSALREAIRLHRVG